MADKLDFSLPQKKSPGSKIGPATLVLLLVLLALVSVHARLTVEMAKRMPRSVSSAGLSEERVKDLASKLAQRNLYPQAAAAWQEYLTSAQLTGPQQAQIHFQIGNLLDQIKLSRSVAIEINALLSAWWESHFHEALHLRSLGVLVQFY